jgi:glycosyltransferase involved in cell wall biosynthesis
MRLDPLIPTFRRPQLLSQALESLKRAEQPRRLQVEVLVINNDPTPTLPGVEDALSAVPFPTYVLHEPQPGKSAAHNAGIAASTAVYLRLAARAAFVRSRAIWCATASTARACQTIRL